MKGRGEKQIEKSKNGRRVGVRKREEERGKGREKNNREKERTKKNEWKMLRK